MSSYHLDHLQYLETEAIHIMREVAAEFERPALLFSGGKNSICLLRLAEKAFRPSDIPMPLLNIETDNELPALLKFRDQRVKKLGTKLIVRKIPLTHESDRGKLLVSTVLAVREEFHLDCLILGVRRDKNRSRAKERFFSHRDAFGLWDPKNQRQEVWNIYNGKLNSDEHMRVFPLSNWTEADVIAFIEREKLEMPKLNN